MVLKHKNLIFGRVVKQEKDTYSGQGRSSEGSIDRQRKAAVALFGQSVSSENQNQEGAKLLAALRDGSDRT